MRGNENERCGVVWCGVVWCGCDGLFSLSIYTFPEAESAQVESSEYCECLYAVANAPDIVANEQNV